MKTTSSTLCSILLSILFLVSGCASAGNKQISDASTVAKIEEGKSTKADVKALVGEPTKVNYKDNGNTEVWEYVYKRGQVRPATFIPVVGWFAGGADVTGSTLTILFDDKGVVKKVGSGKISGGGGSLTD